MTPEQQEKFRSIVALMGKLLVARKDVKAIETQINGQWAWVPDRERVPRNEDPTSGALIPMRMQDFETHMTGKRCMGTYLLDTDSRVKFLAFDIDLKDAGMFLVVRDVNEIEALQAAKTPEEFEGILELDYKVGDLETALHREDMPAHRWGRILLANYAMLIKTQIDKLGLPTLEVLTGGGMHVLVPFGDPIPAADARKIGAEVMEAIYLRPSKGDNFWVPKSMTEHWPVEIEVFPKQDTNQGFGNLIRLPLGWHSGTQRRTYFVDAASRGAAWDMPRADALKALQGAASSLGV